MGVIRYVGISVAASLAGAMVGVGGGWMLGWFLALGYHRRGPSDPGDGPVYATLGLMMVGAWVGAIVALVFGIVFSVRLAHRRAPSHE